MILSRCAILLCLAVLVGGALHCQKQQSSAVTTLSLWHFWSEPSQKKAFLQIIEDFEKEHPTIDIEPVELQWSEGKSKLQLGFASGKPPDIVHIGLEWVRQFADAGVLHSLDSSLFLQVPPQLASSITHEQQYVALPWVMNTRALFVHHKVIEFLRNADVAFTTPADFYACAASAGLPYGFAINALEPHNVSKKVLPLLWASGSRLFTALPFYQSFDSAAVEGLSLYCKLATEGGLIESSRRLDEAMQQGRIAMGMSGMWLLADSAINRQYDVCSAMQGGYQYTSSTVKGESILSGDCFAVSAATKHSDAAMLFLAYLHRYDIQQRFCRAIPDAGIPAHANAANDSSLTSTPNKKAFIQQIFNSRPLPSPVYYLEAEQILEEEIMEAVYARKSPATALQSAQQRINTIENTRTTQR